MPRRTNSPTPYNARTWNESTGTWNYLPGWGPGPGQNPVRVNSCGSGGPVAPGPNFVPIPQPIGPRPPGSTWNSRFGEWETLPTEAPSERLTDTGDGVVGDFGPG